MPSVTARIERGDGRRDRERQGVGDVEHTQILAVVSGRHHVGDQGKIHGQIQAEAESADRHPHQVAVEGVRCRDHEHRRRVDDRRGHHERLASTRAVGESSPDQRGDDDADGLDQRAEIDLPRHLYLAGPEPLQQVVGLSRTVRCGSGCGSELVSEARPGIRSPGVGFSTGCHHLDHGEPHALRLASSSNVSRMYSSACRASRSRPGV